jgi:hypothetical protein
MITEMVALPYTAPGVAPKRSGADYFLTENRYAMTL